MVSLLLLRFILHHMLPVVAIVTLVSIPTRYLIITIHLFHRRSILRKALLIRSVMFSARPQNTVSLASCGSEVFMNVILCVYTRGMDGLFDFTFWSDFDIPSEMPFSSVYDYCSRFVENEYKIHDFGIRVQFPISAVEQEIKARSERAERI